MSMQNSIERSGGVGAGGRNHQLYTVQQQQQRHYRAKEEDAEADTKKTAPTSTTTTTRAEMDLFSLQQTANITIPFDHGLIIEYRMFDDHHHHPHDYTAAGTDDENDDISLNKRTGASSTGGGGGRVYLQMVPDENYSFIHPNCYAPAGLSDVHLLHGGGSGTAVFHGHHAVLGSMVMKHGGYKDCKEIFSLVVIQDELMHLRRRRTPRSSAVDTLQASDNMIRRIPCFVMLYLSPCHLRDRGKELWTSMRQVLMSERVPRSMVVHRSHQQSNHSVPKGIGGNPKRLGHSSSFGHAHQQGKRFLRQLLLHPEPSNQEVDIEVLFNQVILHVPGLHPTPSGEIMINNGSSFLIDLGKHLAELQKQQGWKVTLAQQTIGGPTSEIGAVLLTSGKLQGELLDFLVDEFTQVIRDLKSLTLEEERSGVEQVRMELEILQQTKSVTSVSSMTNLFCGSAITKNFHPTVGRFAKLQSIGEEFYNSEFLLDPQEQVPAEILGRLLHYNGNTAKQAATLDTIFVGAPHTVSALEKVKESWLQIIEEATSLPHASATDRLWTCGLTDAGLHNTFLSPDRGLELFDLGEPKLEPLPGFLTKFLMSFFHTAGMQDSDIPHQWVRRFEVSKTIHPEYGRRLVLTKETKELVPHLYQVFDKVLNHFVQVLLDGDSTVAKLMIKYVVLQLLSDAAFCLSRWEEKGGGTQRYGERGKETLEKWLWRSIWDIYIASHVHQTYLDNDADNDSMTQQQQQQEQ